jgi:hypothetical protein
MKNIADLGKFSRCQKWHHNTHNNSEKCNIDHNIMLGVVHYVNCYGAFGGLYYKNMTVVNDATSWKDVNYAPKEHLLYSGLCYKFITIVI